MILNIYLFSSVFPKLKKNPNLLSLNNCAESACGLFVLRVGLQKEVRTSQILSLGSTHHHLFSGAAGASNQAPRAPSTVSGSI